MKKSIFFVFVCAITTVANAQQADTTVVFNKLVHDFGAIVKSDGTKTYSFEFTNKGSQPVTVQNVTSSCGCTTPDWTKEPVAPGDKGFVKVSYAPSGITAFDKTVTVNMVGGSPGVIVLHIRGSVTASTEKQ